MTRIFSKMARKSTSYLPMQKLCPWSFCIGRNDKDNHVIILTSNTGTLYLGKWQGKSCDFPHLRNFLYHCVNDQESHVTILPSDTLVYGCSEMRRIITWFSSLQIVNMYSLKNCKESHVIRIMRRTFMWLSSLQIQ